MAHLEILSGDDVVYTHPLGPQPVHLGRAKTNDVVLSDRRVSSRHLLVWVEGGAVWVEDAGSRNGTSVAGRPLTGRVAVEPGAVVLLGDSVRMRICGPLDAPPSALRLVLEDPRSGVLYPLRSDHVTVGSAPSCDVALPGLPPVAATLLLHPGEVWLGADGATTELAVDVPFAVAGHALVLRADTGELTGTEALEHARYAYALSVSLDGPTGPTARLRDLRGSAVHEVTSEIRASLLYVLARKLAEDLAAGLGADARGWLHDDDVALGIWGRDRHNQGPNNYLVLVHRLRKEVQAAGFEPWFLEKKRKHLRLRLDQVEVG